MVETKVPVTMSALCQRINRKLAHEQQVLKKARSEYVQAECGTYYLLDVNRNVIMAMHVDPTVLGRELGCIHGYEQVQTGDDAVSRQA